MDDEAAIACHHSSLYTPSPGSTAMAMGAGEAPGLLFDDYDADPHDEAEPLHPQAICDCRRTCSPSSISCRPPNHTPSHLDTKIHSHPHLARPCPAHSHHFHFLFYSTYSYFSNLLSDLASRVGYSSESSTSKVSSSTCHPISTSPFIIPPLVLCTYGYYYYTQFALLRNQMDHGCPIVLLSAHSLGCEHLMGAGNQPYSLSVNKGKLDIVLLSIPLRTFQRPSLFFINPRGILELSPVLIFSRIFQSSTIVLSAHSLILAFYTVPEPQSPVFTQTKVQKI